MDKKFIRFIDSSYKTLFYVPDGGEIKIHSAWDNKDSIFPCKYIDSHHVDINGNCYHICQFAEIMERNGNIYEPVREIGDLDFYEKRFYDHENFGPDGKLVPYYELFTVKQDAFEYKYNYCLTPATESKKFCLFKLHASDMEQNEKLFTADVNSICSDDKLAVRINNIVRAIQEEQECSRETLIDKISLAEQKKESLENADVKVSYSKMCSLFRAVEKSHAERVTGYVVFTDDSFTAPYSEEERTYVIHSDNKAYQPNMGGYSIYGSSLDGSDINVRLEQYMAVERGGKNGWKIERCYMKQGDFDRAQAIVNKLEHEETR